MPDSVFISRSVIPVSSDSCCMEWDNPSANCGRNPADSLSVGRVGYTLGLPAVQRPMLPGNDAGVICLLIVAFMFLSVNFRHYSTFLKTFAQDLWKVRRRENAFDEHTVSETRVTTSLILILCLAEGIIFYSAISVFYPSVPVFTSIAVCSFAAVVLYFIMFVAYRIVGYTFTSADNTRQWLKGYRASQCLLGMVLAVPAMVVLFNPGVERWVVGFALAAYVLARIIFIFKGFRIFYVNTFSLIYFILYLCALELLPPLIMCKAATYLTLIFIS